jgi:DNA-binding response OmpR family regulator
MRSIVLCIEDDPFFQTLIEESLQRSRQFVLEFAPSLAIAREKLRKQNYDAIILDLTLPDGDGLRFLTEMSQLATKTLPPVLILTGQTEVPSRVAAFQLGADDFLAKPFEPLELEARLLARIKKAQTQKENGETTLLGDVEIDQARVRVSRKTRGETVDLGFTAIEFKILVSLTQRLEAVQSRDQLLEKVWPGTYINERTVDSHIAHVREKLTDSKLKVETVKGLGYRARVAND